MKAVTLPFRLKAPNLCSGNVMTFQEHHEARVDRPLDDIDLTEFFMDVQANVRVGDEVTVCAFLDNKWEVLMEVGTVRITEQLRRNDGNRAETRAVWMGEIYKLPKHEQREVFEAGEKALQIKKEFAGGFTVQDDKDAVIERFKTRAEAVDYVARLNGKKTAPQAVL